MEEQINPDDYKNYDEFTEADKKEAAKLTRKLHMGEFLSILNGVALMTVANFIVVMINETYVNSGLFMVIMTIANTLFFMDLIGQSIKRKKDEFVANIKNLAKK